MGDEKLLKSRGVNVKVVNDSSCVHMMQNFIDDNPTLWNEDIGE